MMQWRTPQKGLATARCSFVPTWPAAAPRVRWSLESPHLLDPIQFHLQVRDPLELHVEITAHLVDNLAPFVQQIDDVVEVVSRDVDATALRNSRKFA